MTPELPENSAKCTVSHLKKGNYKFTTNSKIVNPILTPRLDDLPAPGNATTYNLIKKLSMAKWNILQKNTKVNPAEEKIPHRPSESKIFPDDRKRENAVHAGYKNLINIIEYAIV